MPRFEVYWCQFQVPKPPAAALAPGFHSRSALDMSIHSAGTCRSIIAFEQLVHPTVWIKRAVFMLPGGNAQHFTLVLHCPCFRSRVLLETAPAGGGWWGSVEFAATTAAATVPPAAAAVAGPTRAEAAASAPDDPIGGVAAGDPATRA